MANAMSSMSNKNKNLTIYRYDLDPAFDALAVFDRLHHHPYSLFLDSADLRHRDAAFSFVAAFPMEVIEGKDGAYIVTGEAGTQHFDDVSPFDLLRQRMRACEMGMDMAGIEDGAPFQGGAAGLFGYDLARALESLPDYAISDPNMSDMVIGLYDQVFAYDHRTGAGTLYIQARTRAKADTKYIQYCKALEERSAITLEQFDAGAEPEWQSNFSRAEYEAIIQKTIDYIYAGDIFQANIAQRFDAELPGGFDPYRHYLHLRQMNAAPFAAYFNMGGLVLSSASPERFLTVKDGLAQTRPIKGTRPHIHDDDELDTYYRNVLENSEKDRAENIMIVDLLRNDLSKSCCPDSVEVTALCALESFASVHHLVSTIQGRLRASRDALHLLEGCFPGGSITGAPKIRAMEIIDELEQVRRGPYCGSIGYIGVNGSMDTNILIRTLVYQDSKVSFQVGGGIVADSDPSEEYDETLAKAHGLFESFKAPRRKNGLKVNRGRKAKAA